MYERFLMTSTPSSPSAVSMVQYFRPLCFLNTNLFTNTSPPWIQAKITSCAFILRLKQWRPSTLIPPPHHVRSRNYVMTTSLLPPSCGHGNIVMLTTNMRPNEVSPSLSLVLSYSPPPLQLLSILRNKGQTGERLTLEAASSPVSGEQMMIKQKAWPPFPTSTALPFCIAILPCFV